MAKVTKQLKISGRVQGVGFRYSMCDQAIKFKVTGWVKNAADGTVQSIVQGEEAAVQALIDWAKKGTDSSNVENIEISDGTGEFKEFEIAY